MIRASEMVLPGHPDKFCDQVADAIVAECYAVDPEAYCQVEVSVWSDRVWLSGGTGTRTPLRRPLEAIVKQVGREIGYVKGNAIDADLYQVHDVVCQAHGDPRQWTHRVNDQSISVGWAGYDAKVAYLPPEHFLAEAFREALTVGCREQALAGCGPDGKLLVRLRENSDSWVLEHVLVTLQQRESAHLADVIAGVDQVLESRYAALRRRDPRWQAPWQDVELCVNPNGPLVDAGSQGDNGQTGRKLAMDFYGPRVPIGGGAIFGKDLSHIDRLGAYASREAAVEAVQAGARECKVVLCYAPNRDVPLDVVYELDTVRRIPQKPREAFAHSALRGTWGPGRAAGRSPCGLEAWRLGLRGVGVPKGPEDETS